MRTLAFLLIGGVSLAAGDEPVVDRITMLIDTVRRGDLISKVDGYGKLRKVRSALEAVVDIPTAKSQDVRAGQAALIDVREGLLHGTVSSIGDAHDQKRSVVVTIGAPTVALSDEEPVASSIQTDELKNVLLVGRTGLFAPETAVTVFKLESGGEFANRIEVRVGKMNDRQVEIRSGLAEGDKVIITRLNLPEGTQRIRLK